MRNLFVFIMQQHLFRRWESLKYAKHHHEIFIEAIYSDPLINLNRKESRDQHTFLFTIRVLHTHFFSLAIHIEITKHIPVQYFISHIDPVERKKQNNRYRCLKWMVVSCSYSSLLTFVVLFLNDIIRMKNHFHQDETDDIAFTHMSGWFWIIPNSRNIGATKHSKIPFKYIDRYITHTYVCIEQNKWEKDWSDFRFFRHSCLIYFILFKLCRILEWKRRFLIRFWFLGFLFIGWYAAQGEEKETREGANVSQTKREREKDVIQQLKPELMFEISFERSWRRCAMFMYCLFMNGIFRIIWCDLGFYWALQPQPNSRVRHILLVMKYVLPCLCSNYSVFALLRFFSLKTKSD